MYSSFLFKRLNIDIQHLWGSWCEMWLYWVMVREVVRHYWLNIRHLALPIYRHLGVVHRLLSVRRHLWECLHVIQKPSIHHRCWCVPLCVRAIGWCHRSHPRWLSSKVSRLIVHILKPWVRWLRRSRLRNVDLRWTIMRIHLVVLLSAIYFGLIVILVNICVFSLICLLWLISSWVLIVLHFEWKFSKNILYLTN